MIAPPVVEDPRVALLMDAFRVLQEDEGIPSDRDAAEVAVEVLDRHDEQQGVVRVNLAKQRAIDADRGRLRGALHAVLQSFESGDANGTECLQSIPVPRSMVEGWCLIAEGGG